jgi:hypothetical protein
MNNQIKRLFIRFPSRSASSSPRLNALDLVGRAANWFRKYPSCSDLFTRDGPAGSGVEICFGFTKRMARTRRPRSAVHEQGDVDVKKEEDEPEDEAARLDCAEKRWRFYKVLFGDDSQ